MRSTDHRHRRVALGLLAILCAQLLRSAPATSAASNYILHDPELKVVVVDSDPKESFLSLQLDGAGRLFAGGREGLFVSEPDPKGLYQPRQLLDRFPPNSWISDIAIRGQDLYVATHTAIYLLEGAVTRRTGLHPQRLLWGAPPLAYFEEHQGFHGLVFGPDGDLYVSFGDNLVGYGDFQRADHWGHWTFFHAQNRTPYTGAGGFLRLSPDGARMEVLARGCRNPCGLAFDSNWNLFSNDNDHESIPAEYVPGRLLYVTPQAEFGWPRGWLLEKHPWRADLLDTLHPSLGRYVPTSQSYYDEAYLPGRFRNNLLIAEWGKGLVPRYPLRPSGAGFKADELPLLTCTNTARPVGLAVGRGGRIFVATLYMAANEVSPIARSDILMITRADDPPHAPFAAYEPTKASERKLRSELRQPSWQSRYRASTEWLRRIASAGKPLLKAKSLGAPGLWLGAAQGQMDWVVTSARSKDHNTRLQAIRAITRFGHSPADYDRFVEALADDQLSVVQAALTGLALRFDHYPVAAVQSLACSADTYVRQAACQLLAARAPLDELQALAEAVAPERRLAGVVALGTRLTVPPATQPLPADCPLDVSTFNPKPQYDGGVEDLRSYGRIGAFTMAGYWAKKTRSADEERIFNLLARRLHDADPRVARQSAFYLRLLADPRSDAAAAVLLGITNAPVVQPIQGAVAATSIELPVEYRGRAWADEAAAGHPEQGRVLFEKLGCVKCHAARESDVSGGGPSLVSAGARFSAAYLAESILVPNKEVSPAFRWTEVILADDEEASGLVVGETDSKLEMLLINGTRRTLDKKAITSRQIRDLSPMPEGLIKDPAELRDLLSYLMASPRRLNP